MMLNLLLPFYCPPLNGLTICMLTFGTPFYEHMVITAKKTGIVGLNVTTRLGYAQQDYIAVRKRVSITKSYNGCVIITISDACIAYSRPLPKPTRMD